MGLFLLPQTALAVDAAAPASTSVSSPLAALWRVLLTPITVPHLPWQLPLLAPVALVLALLVLIFCLLARRGGYRRGFREGERVVMRQMAREEQEAAVPPMPHRPAPQQPAAPKPAPQPERAPTSPPAEEKKPAPPAAEKPASPVRETPAPPPRSLRRRSRTSWTSICCWRRSSGCSSLLQEAEQSLFLIGPGADALHLIAGLADGGPQGLRPAAPR